MSHVWGVPNICCPCWWSLSAVLPCMSVMLLDTHSCTHEAPLGQPAPFWGSKQGIVPPDLLVQQLLCLGADAHGHLHNVLRPIQALILSLACLARPSHQLQGAGLCTGEGLSSDVALGMTVNVNVAFMSQALALHAIVGGPQPLPA